MIRKIGHALNKIYLSRVGFWILAASIGLVLGFLGSRAISLTRITGDSMEPLLHNGQYMIINRLSYIFDDPSRNDIVVCKLPFVEENVVKRVVGIPGDTIDIIDAQVYLNRELLIEDYIKEPMENRQHKLYNELIPDTNIYDYLNRDIILEKDEYFIMGDNRNNSLDSRIVGAVDKDMIWGKIIIFK